MAEEAEEGAPPQPGYPPAQPQQVYSLPHIIGMGWVEVALDTHTPKCATRASSRARCCVAFVSSMPRPTLTPHSLAVLRCRLGVRRHQTFVRGFGTKGVAARLLPPARAASCCALCVCWHRDPESDGWMEFMRHTIWLQCGVRREGKDMGPGSAPELGGARRAARARGPDCTPPCTRRKPGSWLLIQPLGQPLG